MKANPVVPFSFEHHPVRVVVIDGAPWFIAADICKALGLSNPTKAVASLDDDEKNLFNGDSNLKLGSAGSGAQSVIIINESGLYMLVLRCRDAVKQGTLPHRFRKWVTTEVLPAIRKTGKYQQPAAAKSEPEQSVKMTIPLVGRVPNTPAVEISGAISLDCRMFKDWELAEMVLNCTREMERRLSVRPEF